jgi:hypothetical protein
MARKMCHVEFVHSVLCSKFRPPFNETIVDLIVCYLIDAFRSFYLQNQDNNKKYHWDLKPRIQNTISLLESRERVSATGWKLGIFHSSAVVRVNLPELPTGKGRGRKWRIENAGTGMFPRNRSRRIKTG